MTEEQMNIAIAESQGISDCIVREQEHVNVEGREVTYWEELGGYKDGKYHRIPDYANDLNAMHELEKSIKEPASYAGWLEAVTESEIAVGSLDPQGQISYRSLFRTAHASARQRAEAYLRTIGRFEDE